MTRDEIEAAINKLIIARKNTTDPTIIANINDSITDLEAQRAELNENET